jgi:CBS domain-containing protein
MNDAKVRRMPVVDENGKAVGIISFGDILAFLSREFAELTRTTTPAQKIEAKLKEAA